MTSFIHISDVHFGQEDRSALALVEAAIEEFKPDAVIVSGDITALGAGKEMRSAFAWLRGLRAPAIVTPGNHDTPYYDVAPRIFNPFGSFRRESKGVRTEPWIDPKFVILPINTARGVQWRKNWALGAISGAQVRRACEVLKAAPDHCVKIIVSHHPLSWPAGAPIPGETRGGLDAQEALMAAGASMFLSGHLHHSSVSILNAAGLSAIAVNAGTLSIRQRGETASFVLIHDFEGMWSIERISSEGRETLLTSRLQNHDADASVQR